MKYKVKGRKFDLAAKAGKCAVVCLPAQANGFLPMKMKIL
jgi:hypothetical protein